MNVVRKKNLTNRPLGLALVVGATAALGLIFMDASIAQGQETATPIAVETVSRDSGASALELAGSFVAQRRARLSTEIAGLVDRIEVEVGDNVEAGHLLLGLDSTLATLSLARFEAAVSEAEARAVDATRQADETQSLRSSGAISSTIIESNQAAAQVAKSALQSARAGAREQAERVARHELRAPFAGVVANRLVEIGEWVGVGTQTLELVALDKVWLEVQFPQGRFDSLSPETPVRVVTEIDPNVTLSGVVIASVPVVDTRTRTLRVRIAVEADGGVLIPGSSATARFELGDQAGVVQVSRDALVRRPDGSMGVWVVEEEGDSLSVRAARVMTGRSIGANVEIREGLRAGDRVVVRGNESLTQGQAVSIVPTSNGLTP